MRNLKKVLTLVLTLAMLLSVMVVGAGAATFSDQDSIKNTEAVNTCNALNIINGENGSFYPTRNVTRAEMCKMICVALNGGREPALATGIGNTFTDTVGHWASPYIEYCVREGVVGGIGGGLFDPNGAVTGTQAAKMLLVAMGYDASRQGYVGSNAWELNINGDASKKGLYVRLESIDASAPLNRDNAAQLIYNALDATMVEYVFSAQTVNGTLTMVPTLKDKTHFVAGTERPTTILSEKFKVSANYGQLVDIDGGKLVISADTNYSTKATGIDTTFTKVATDYTDYLGQTVKVLYKETDNVLGLAPVDGIKTYTVAASAIEAKDNKVKFNDTEYKMEAYDGSDGSNVANQINRLTIGNEDIVADTVNVSTLTAGVTSSYDTITFVDIDNDGVLEYAVVTKVATGKVTYTNSDEIIAGGTTYDRADNKIASDVAKNEYVSIYYNAFDKGNVIDTIKKGTAKASINAAGTKYMFDGTWFHKGPMVTTATAGTNYDYWTYNGVMVAIDQAGSDASIDNLVMVLKLSTGTLSNQARILNADGTKVNVDVVDNDYSKTDVNFGDLDEGTLYLASETSKGWTFEAISNEQEIGDYTFASSGNLSTSSTTIEQAGGNAISDDAVVFVYGGDTMLDGKILTGKELKSLTYGSSKNTVLEATNGYFTSKVNGLTRATIVAVAMENSSDELVGGNVLGDNFGLIVSDAFKLDSDYVQYTMWNGEKTVVVKEKGVPDTLMGLRPQFTVINYDTIDAENVVSGVSVPTLATSYTAGNLTVGSVFSTQDNKLWYTNTDSLKLTSDTVYMYYDSSTETAENIGKTQGSLEMADESASGVKIPNVKFIGNASGEVEFVLIDVKNSIEDDLTAAAYNYTVTSPVADFGGSGVATATFSKTSGVCYGETLTLTIEVAATKTLAAGTYTLTNAVNTADGTAKITVPETTAPAEKSVTLTYTVAVTNTGATIAASADVPSP